MQSQNHATSYVFMVSEVCIHMHTYPQESDLKKPNAPVRAWFKNYFNYFKLLYCGDKSFQQ